MEDIAIAFRDWKVLKASGRQAYQDFSNALLARSHACAGREAWFGDGLHSSGLPRAMTLRAEADAINRSIDLEEVVRVRARDREREKRCSCCRRCVRVVANVGRNWDTLCLAFS